MHKRISLFSWTSTSRKLWILLDTTLKMRIVNRMIVFECKYSKLWLQSERIWRIYLSMQTLFAFVQSAYFEISVAIDFPIPNRNLEERWIVFDWLGGEDGFGIKWIILSFAFVFGLLPWRQSLGEVSNRTLTNESQPGINGSSVPIKILIV